MFFVIGFLFTIVSMIVTFFIRGNIELNDDGKLTEVAKKELGSGFKAVRNSAIDVWNMISKVVAEKMFWVYIGMLALTLFVRFVFFHFSYTFPKYGISILGEGAKLAILRRIKFIPHNFSLFLSCILNQENGII